ncbi:hypothetical protein [Nocardia sp. NPDC002869]|uniref:hypothetical protein n=1 Tax=Nocardia sp. NPDC002869 TaxID=3161032 RepID=UPI00398CFD66
MSLAYSRLRVHPALGALADSVGAGECDPYTAVDHLMGPVYTGDRSTTGVATE